jgi:GT2 family glycosyltransferase
MTPPRFSIILVNWNTTELVVQAIESVLADSLESGIPVEVIVVDNGSAPPMQFPPKWEGQVHVLRNEQNRGFARAVNPALAIHQGEHVMLLNTDAVLLKGTLPAILATFQSAPQIGIIGANLRNEDGSPQNSIAPFPSLLTELGNKALLGLLAPGRHERKVKDEVGDAMECVPPVRGGGKISVIGACLAIRGETLAAIGPLDERFFFFYEETDWCYQAHRLGWQVVVAPAALVVHGQGKSSETVLEEVRIEYYRSRYRYFLKNKGKLATILLFEGLILKLMVENLSALVTVFFTLGRKPRPMRRLRVVAMLLAWHLRGCPRGWGLEGRFKAPV